MYTPKLPPRKRDALDTWNDLFQRRYQAYIHSDWNTFTALNNLLKVIRREGSWNEAEIEEEFRVYDALPATPFEAPAGNPNIHYDMMVGGEPQNMVLSINQVSIYWT